MLHGIDVGRRGQGRDSCLFFIIITHLLSPSHWMAGSLSGRMKTVDDYVTFYNWQVVYLRLQKDALQAIFLLSRCMSFLFLFSEIVVVL
jgi:hypothetical protein